MPYNKDNGVVFTETIAPVQRCNHPDKHEEPRSRRKADPPGRRGVRRLKEMAMNRVFLSSQGLERGSLDNVPEPHIKELWTWATDSKCSRQKACAIDSVSLSSHPLGC